MYAVIKTGGKQHKVAEGDVIEVEILHGTVGDSVSLQPLLVVDDEGATHVGKALGKATVKAELLGDKKGDKVKVFKYKNKTGYARKTGHRQMLSMVRITQIGLPSQASTKKAAEPKAEEPAKADPKSEEAAEA
jgi:large subunit ribosomal protein L21